MRYKIKALEHINQTTRKEVLQWCRDYEEELTRLRDKCENYETEVLYMKRQCQMAGISKEGTDLALIRGATYDVKEAVQRADTCHVFYTGMGKFKVLTQQVRIDKEKARLVGIYDINFIREKLIGDLQCTLNDVRGTTVL